MTSPVDIVNIALASFGAQSTISSFDEGSPEADAAKLLYGPKINALFRAAPWAFARKQIYLTQLKALIIDGVLSDTADRPPQPWYYEYQYPSDCIKIRYLLPNFVASDSGVSIPFTTGPGVQFPYQVWDTTPIRFQRATDLDADGNQISVLLTNVFQAQAVYTCTVDSPDLWDQSFLDAATLYLGTWLLQALAQDRAGFRDMISVTNNILSGARAVDGNEQIVSTENTPDWLLARGAGGPTANLNYIGWEYLAWPDGTSS